MKLKENVFVEEDISKNCVDYPHGKYETYNDCDEDFVASNLPLGLLPIWFTNNTEDVTSSYLSGFLNSYIYRKLHDGRQKSTCPLPCSTFHVESKYQSEADEKFPVIHLNLIQDITVTKTEFLKFTFEKFLSDVGGSMGLWLGLGILQSFELFTNYVCRIRGISEIEEPKE